MTYRSTIFASGLFTVTALAAGTAAADPATDAITLSALDRASGTTDAGVDLAFVFGTGESDLDGFASRLDLHGQYLHASGFGAYGALGVSRAFFSSEDPGNDMLVDAINDETGLTNLELGGQYARTLTSDLDLVAHVGVALPTASDGLGVLANGVSQYHRMNDLVLVMPETTTLRVGVSPVFHRGMLFARADLGADIPVDSPAEMELDPLIHANVAVGLRRGKLSAALEVVNVATTGDADSLGDRFINVATVGARYRLGRYAPSIAISTPLDEGRGDVIAVQGALTASF